MPDHPVPQGDDIILPDGTVVGSWNGDDVKDLQVEVQRIIKEQKEPKEKEILYPWQSKKHPIKKEEIKKIIGYPW